jgi:hypothetical protein
MNRLRSSGIRAVYERNGIPLSGSAFEITSKTGSPIFFMTETGNCLGRMLPCQWLGIGRSFTAHVVDACGVPSFTVSNSSKGLNCYCCYTSCATACCCCTPLSSKVIRLTLYTYSSVSQNINTVFIMHHGWFAENQGILPRWRNFGAHSSD